jgi:Heterokaryon incompatibility protein (HET)
MAAPAASQPTKEPQAEPPPSISLEDLGLDPDEDLKKNEPKFFTQGMLAACRAALITFIIREGLPEGQRWIYYTLMLQHRQNFINLIYPLSLGAVFLLWYRPTTSPSILYNVTVIVDRFKRPKYYDIQEIYDSSIISLVDYNVILLILHSAIDIRNLTPLLESVLGPADFWPRAIIPILPGLLSSDQRFSINGFVPEGRQGILMAIFVWACTAVLPLWAQWVLWPFFSAPDFHYPAMVVEWFLCTLAWALLGTPPQVAYCLHLFVNQFPHPEFYFRHHGGGPSTILERERRGCVWFITISFLLRVCEVNFGPSIAENGTLNFPPRIWFPLILVLAIGLYLLNYGLAIRLAKFKHQPIRGRDSIRLLRLRAQPCFTNSPIQCDMIHAKLRFPPPYTAISHRWGLLGEEQQIILIDNAPFLVSPSIHSLLLAKRDPRRSVLLWTDSICINQADAEEKSRQVGIMRNIFEEASSTIGWLGDDPGAKKAFDLVERINSAPNIAAFTRLRQEQDAGWAELQKLVSNSWFERVWIIQEIAVAKNPLIRYGDQEIEWKTLVTALFVIIALGFTSGKADNFFESRQLLNALVMENIRLLVEDVDHLRLKDALKLGLRFEATLPVDKVYAFLGIVEERNSSLFYPKFSRTDSFSAGTSRKAGLWKDLLNTIDACCDFLGTIEGSSNTRRGRLMLSSDKRLRHAVGLNRDLKKIMEKLKRIQQGKPDFEYEPIHPDYSEKKTPELVYTFVARDLIRQGDVFSVIRHAGIKLARNEMLKSLPSWVPDWSTDVDTYVLPHCDPSRPGNSKYTKAHDKESRGKVNEETVRDGGLNFLYVKGAIIGKVMYLSTLSENVKGSSADVFEDARQDFKLQYFKYDTARALARQHAQCLYPTQEGLDNAFLRIILADAGADGSRPAPDHAINRWRSWINGWREGCEISAALWPEKAQDYWANVEGADDPDTLRKSQERICRNYLFIRRMQSSPNTRFAHLVKTDISPSFNRYRWRDEKDDPVASAMEEKGNEQKRQVSMFDSKEPGPLSGYSEYVDYTIGRKFAISDSGHIGLVPGATQEGDVVVWMKSEKLCLLLRRMDFQGQQNGDGKGQGDNGKTPEGKAEEPGLAWPPDEAFRLVGEAYFHDPDARAIRKRKSGNERWFKLW